MFTSKINKELIIIIKLSLKDKKVARMLIAERGKSLRAYSKEIGISHVYLSQVLNERRNPSPTVAHKISSGLGLKIEDLFIFEDKPSRLKEVF